MKTPTNTSRDLLLLAMIAHSKHKYDTAGSLFSAAMASSDVEDLVDALSSMTDDPNSDISQSSDCGINPHVNEAMSLSAIAAALSASMAKEDEAEAEADEELESEEADEADEEDADVAAEDDDAADDKSPAAPVDSTAEGDDGDDSTDDYDEDNPGTTLLPSSISVALSNSVAATSSAAVRRVRPRLDYASQSAVAVDYHRQQPHHVAEQRSVFKTASSSPITLRTTL